jgi:hypothetical protein
MATNANSSDLLLSFLVASVERHQRVVRHISASQACANELFALLNRQTSTQGILTEAECEAALTSWINTYGPTVDDFIDLLSRTNGTALISDLGLNASLAHTSHSLSTSSTRPRASHQLHNRVDNTSSDADLIATLGPLMNELHAKLGLLLDERLVNLTNSALDCRKACEAYVDAVANVNKVILAMSSRARAELDCRKQLRTANQKAISVFQRLVELRRPQCNLIDQRDVFLAHAGEAKLLYIQGILKEAITKRKWTTWLDIVDIHVSDKSTRLAVDQGLLTSRVVLLATDQQFVCKKWPLFEMFFAVARANVDDSDKFDVLFDLWDEKLFANDWFDIIDAMELPRPISAEGGFSPAVRRKHECVGLHVDEVMAELGRILPVTVQIAPEHVGVVLDANLNAWLGSEKRQIVEQHFAAEPSLTPFVAEVNARLENHFQFHLTDVLKRSSVVLDTWIRKRAPVVRDLVLLLVRLSEKQLAKDIGLDREYDSEFEKHYRRARSLTTSMIETATPVPVPMVRSLARSQPIVVRHNSTSSASSPTSSVALDDIESDKLPVFPPESSTDHEPLPRTVSIAGYCLRGVLDIESGEERFSVPFRVNDQALFIRRKSNLRTTYTVEPATNRNGDDVGNCVVLRLSSRFSRFLAVVQCCANSYWLSSTFCDPFMLLHPGHRLTLCNASLPNDRAIVSLHVETIVGAPVGRPLPPSDPHVHKLSKWKKISMDNAAHDRH